MKIELHFHYHYFCFMISCFFDSDIEISRSQTPKNITVLAQEIGVHPNELELYGNKKAKLSLKIVDRLKNAKNGNYIVVAGYS